MKRSIQVPSPCSASWNKMTPSEKGAFCSECSKEVIDFRLKSKDEIIQTITNSTDTVCGRFRPNQLDQPNKTDQNKIIKHRFLSFSKLAMSFVVFLQVFGLKSVVKANNIVGGGFIFDFDANKEALFPTTTKGIKARGIVLDSNSNPVINSEIYLMKSGVKELMAITDIDGNFEFSTAFIHLKNINAELIIESKGYETKVINEFLINNNLISFEIHLNEIEMVDSFEFDLMGDVININYAQSTTGVCIAAPNTPDEKKIIGKAISPDFLLPVKIDIGSIPTKEVHELHSTKMEKEIIVEANDTSNDHEKPAEDEPTDNSGSKAIEITTYPNPTTQYVTIELSEFKIYNFTLMNVNAEIILEGKSEGRIIQLDLGGKANGVYLINIFSEGKFIAAKRIILER